MFNETPTAIEFAYPLDALFSQVSLQSIYSAKNMAATPLGLDATDAYGIMTDERDFVNAHIPRAISDLFALFVKQTNTIIDSLFVKKPLGTSPNTVDCCGFSIVREMDGHRPLYNPNRLSVIDYNCSDYLKNYILLEWAKTNKIIDNITIYSNALKENETHIRNNNFELKKGQYAKTYNIFSQST